jgi:hypothetical protein
MKSLLFGFEGRINRAPFWIAGTGQRRLRRRDGRAL